VTSAVPRLVGKQFLLRRRRTTLGRNRGRNDIALYHFSVSHAHAVIERDPTTGAYVIADLRSTNGVRVNGHAYRKVELRGGDFVDLGWVRLYFVARGQPFSDLAVTPLPARKRRRGRR
jgi:pSer/pThr/pTyr-binding forkhead associated (FHA) protein